MKKVLILGAHGQIAQLVTARLLAETTDIRLMLYLRHSERLTNPNPSRVEIIDGDVNDLATLSQAVAGQDLVYANLGGEFEPMARKIVQTMTTNQVKRLIYVTGLGLYHEVPGEFGRWGEASIGTPVMDDTRRAAALIEQSNLNYTIIRAAYMNDDPQIDYELTVKGEPFKGTIISRASLADLIVKIIRNPQLHQFASLGVDQPGTDGDRPY
ncbi:NAD(P)H-binding protein [Lapidilactobacillus luobeiensis]|uniref:NAD(P)H-binding protein n=1 Tax=Lapidilactobacillus luobeiensis TaxID=2950371 RepID=UPI0021C45E65|nr:NAD(P)H-binding protein [Lapidilactobacillus luobeiensis]